MDRGEREKGTKKMGNTWEKENGLFGSKNKRSANEKFFTKKKNGSLSLSLLLEFVNITPYTVTNDKYVKSPLISAPLFSFRRGG